MRPQFPEDNPPVRPSPGVVACIHDTAEAWHEALAAFAAEGLEAGDHVSALLEPAEVAALATRLAASGHDVAALRRDGRLILLPAEGSDALTEDLEALMSVLAARLSRCRESGCAGLRVIGARRDPTYVVSREEALRRLGRLQPFLEAGPCRLLWGYDRTRLVPRLVKEAFDFFPQLVLDGVLHENPHYVGHPGGPDGDAAEPTALWIERLRERHRAEAALRASEGRFRSLFDHTGDGLYLHDRQGRLLDANQAACAMLGYARAELLELTLTDIVAPEGRARVPHRLAEVDAQGSARFESEHLAADGRRIPVEVHVTRLEDQDPPLFLSSARDIGERKRAQAHTERLALAVTQAAEAVLITDAQGVIEFINPAFEAITGYPERDVVGRSPWFLFGEEREAILARIQEHLDAWGVWTGRAANVRKDGRRVDVEVVVTRLQEGGGPVTGYVVLERDITREVSLENQLRHAQKMEALGRFTGGIAHDFNNLLTVIVSSVALMDEQLAGAEAEVRDCLADVRQAAQRGADLVRRLLVFNRREEVRLRPVELTEVVYGLRGTLRRLLPENVALELDVLPCLPPARADQGAVEQIVMNLAANARDAIGPRAGTVTLSLREARLETAQGAGAEAAPPGRYLCLRMSDTGCGMDADTQVRVFEPFFTTKPPGEGTGLGLAVVYGLVRQHGGHIRLESAPGQGTAFDLLLPVSREAPAPERPAPATVGPSGTETLLVVEDEPGLRRVTRRTLERLGYRVLLADDGEQALEVLRRRATRIDLVLTDVVMPRLGGPGLWRAMRAEGLARPIVFVSGYTARDQSDAPLDPAIPLLQKPWTGQELARTIREALDARSLRRAVG